MGGAKPHIEQAFGGIKSAITDPHSITGMGVRAGWKGLRSIPKAVAWGGTAMPWLYAGGKELNQ